MKSETKPLCGFLARSGAIGAQAVDGFWEKLWIGIMYLFQQLEESSVFSLKMYLCVLVVCMNYLVCQYSAGLERNVQNGYVYYLLQTCKFFPHIFQLATLHMRCAKKTIKNICMMTHFPHKVRKVTFSSDEKWLLGCLWLRPRIRAHNKLLRQNLDLFKLIFFFALHQFSSSNSHC